MRVAERAKIKDQEGKKKQAALLHLIIVLDMNNIKYCPVLLHICQCLTDRHSQIEGAETCARPQIQCQTSHPAAAAAAKEKSTLR
jgi:hypothetical protein